jgi:hypothetical protein
MNAQVCCRALILQTMASFMMPTHGHGHRRHVGGLIVPLPVGDPNGRPATWTVGGAAAPLPLLGALGRLRCGSACPRQPGLQHEVGWLGRRVDDAEGPVAKTKTALRSSSSGATGTSALGVSFNTAQRSGHSGWRYLPLTRPRRTLLTCGFAILRLSPAQCVPTLSAKRPRSLPRPSRCACHCRAGHCLPRRRHPRSPRQCPRCESQQWQASPVHRWVSAGPPPARRTMKATSATTYP